MHAAAESGSRDITAMAQAMNDIQNRIRQHRENHQGDRRDCVSNHILALNAAVEAARAGEAGAGFLPWSPRKCARSRSGPRAQRARRAERIDACIAKSHDGAAITQKVTTGFADITTKAREVNTLVIQITAATKEQSTGLSQVSQAVCDLDKVTQKNACFPRKLPLPRPSSPTTPRGSTIRPSRSSESSSGRKMRE